MVNQNNQPKAVENFATNWQKRNEETLQLLLSAAVWKRYGYRPNEKVQIEKQIQKVGDQTTKTTFLLNDEPVLMVSKSTGEDFEEIPMHQTLFVL